MKLKHARMENGGDYFENGHIRGKLPADIKLGLHRLTLLEHYSNIPTYLLFSELSWKHYAGNEYIIIIDQTTIECPVECSIHSFC